MHRHLCYIFGIYFLILKIKNLKIDKKKSETFNTAKMPNCKSYFEKYLHANFLTIKK